MPGWVKIRAGWQSHDEAEQTNTDQYEQGDVMSILMKHVVCSVLAFGVGFWAANVSASDQGSKQGHSPDRISLHVAMFPYVPDAGRDGHASYLRYIEENFEKRHPHIDLVLRSLNPRDDFYDMDVLKGWLTAAPGQGGYDLVEVDTVLLGDLVTAGLISPWSEAPARQDWHPVADRAVSLNGATYGVPRLMCGHFLMTRSVSASKANNASELAAALRAIGNETPDLAARLTGSWNLPSLYLDAWQDAHPRSSSAYALHSDLDSDVVQQLRIISKRCADGDKNPCLHGGYDGDDLHPYPAAEALAKGEVDAAIGYSEGLHTIVSIAGHADGLHVTAAPLGNGKSPLLFTDALVARRDAGSKQRDAAQAFSAFIISPEVQEALLTSADVSLTAVPRYLLPATRSAFDRPRLRKDRLYRALRASIARSSGMFPNTGFLNMRKPLRDAVERELLAP
jgi:thiamine pyridinylase